MDIPTAAWWKRGNYVEQDGQGEKAPGAAPAPQGGKGPAVRQSDSL